MKIIARVRIKIRDKDGNNSIIQWYYDSAFDNVSIATDIIGGAIPVLEAIIDGVITGFVIEYMDNDFNGEAGEDSNINRKALLFLQDDDENVNALYLLSPTNIFEDIGSYAGIRIDSTKISDFLDAIESLSLVTLDGVSLGNTYLVGGLTY